MTNDRACGQPMVNRIFPQNLTAQAAYNVLGNHPVRGPRAESPTATRAWSMTTAISTADSSLALRWFTSGRAPNRACG
jgi:hypothetical protein